MSSRKPTRQRSVNSKSAEQTSIPEKYGDVPRILDHESSDSVIPLPEPVGSFPKLDPGQITPGQNISTEFTISYPYTLTENGKAKAVIVLATAPTCAAAFGAAELQSHIWKISKAMLPVVSGDSDAEIATKINEIIKAGMLLPACTRIFVGENKALNTLPQIGKLQTDTEKFKSQEYAVYALPQDIVLIGHDADSKYGEYVAFPKRVQGRKAGNNACCFIGMGQCINIPYVKLLDMQGIIEAWIMLPKEPSIPLNEGDERETTILDIEEPDNYSRHEIVHRIKKSKGNYENCIRYKIEYSPPEESTIITNTLVCLDANAPVNTWLHIEAKYSKDTQPTLKVTLDGTATFWTGIGETVVYGEGGKITRCQNQVLSIGRRPWLKTIGESTYRTKHPIHQLLHNLGLCGTDIIRHFTDKLDDTFIFGQSFDGIVSEVKITGLDIILHLKFNESVGARYVVDDETGLVIAPTPGIWEDRGSLDAVYDFLENSCGVRWYAPMDIGIVHPMEKTLVVNALTYRRRPSMDLWRGFADDPPELNFTSRSWVHGSIRQALQIPLRDLHIWMLRMHIGGMMAPYSAGLAPEICMTDLNVVKKEADQAEGLMLDWLLGEKIPPYRNIHSLIPVDGYYPYDSPTCSCLDKVNDSKISWNESHPNEGNEFQNGALSEYIFDFTNQVARQIIERHPEWQSANNYWEDNLWIGQHAYDGYRYPPEKPMEPNVIMRIALHAREWCREHQRTIDTEAIEKWREINPKMPLWLWLYYDRPAYFPTFNVYDYKWRHKNPNKATDYYIFPGFFAHTIVEQMANNYAKNNIRGIIMEHSGQHIQYTAQRLNECDAYVTGLSYLFDQLELYVTLKLAYWIDDSKTPSEIMTYGNSLIDEFFGRYYGPAGREMRSIYNCIENVYMTSDRRPSNWIQNTPAKEKSDQCHTYEVACNLYKSTVEGVALEDKLKAHIAEAELRSGPAITSNPYWLRFSLFKSFIWDEYMVEAFEKYLPNWRCNPNY